MTAQYDLIVVGAGHAGYSLIRELRRLGSSQSILLICQDSGDFYSKPLLSNAFSKGKSAEQLRLKTAKEMEIELQLTLLANTSVHSISPSQQRVDCHSASFEYRQLVLATGAAPIQLPLPAACQGHTYSINDLAQFEYFRLQLKQGQRIAVLGSGLVGIEYANDLALAGYQVQLISLDQRPLQKLLPAELGVLLQQKLQAIGVEFYLQSQISTAQQQADGLLLTLADQRQFSCDVVLSAVGLKPRLELALAAGLTCGKGIQVNQWQQTSDPAIYALGDCAEINGQLHMYIQPISLAAKALAQTLTGQTTALQLPVFPVIVKSASLAVVSCPAPVNCAGHWQLSGEGDDWQALYRNDQDQLCGFALTGKMVAQRLKLAKDLSVIDGITLPHQVRSPESIDKNEMRKPE